MKKTVLILTMGLWGGWLCAQEIPDCDYNPYQHQREEYLQTGREMYQDLMNSPCGDPIHMNSLLEEYNKNKNDRYGKDVLYGIGRMNCDTVVPFLLHLLLTDSDEEVRCDALLILGWHRPQELVPFFLEYVKRDISPKEKIAVASVLCVMEHFDKALPILDEYCLKMEEMNQTCWWSYAKCGNTYSSLSFFNHYINSEQYHLRALHELTILGEYAKTYPFYLKLINSDNNNDKLSALSGLATIGTEECFQLIQRETKSTNPKIKRKAESIFNYIKMKKREKCGE